MTTLGQTIYVYNSQLGKFTHYHATNDENNGSAIGPALPALGHALSGSAGTAISKLVTYPLDLIITRLQVQKQLQRHDTNTHYDGFLDAIEKIYEREGGLQAFYSGALHETAKGVVDSFLFFLAYTYLRQKRLNAPGGRKSLGAFEEIGVGMVAGAFSKFFTTPIQQIVTRKQTAAMMKNERANDIPPLSSTRDIALEIHREKGLQGFWSGYSASLVLTLNPSITMLLHKVLLRLFVPHEKRDDPGARVTFLVAAVSKALASTVTYPFSLAKTRAQVSSQKPSATIGETSEMDRSGKRMESKAARVRQRTVFSTIFRIAQTEGLWGLYQGLGPEVLKGFFSHGITMLMKDRIHAVIINLYYLVLKSLEKYPSPGEIAKTASEKVHDVYEDGKEKAGEVYAKGAEVVEQAVEKAKDVAAEGSHQAQELVETGKEQAGEAYAKGSQAVEWSSQKTTELLEAGKEQASDAYTQGAQAAEKASWAAQDVVTEGSDHVGEVLESGKKAAGESIEQAKDALSKVDAKNINGPVTGGKD